MSDAFNEWLKSELGDREIARPTCLTRGGADYYVESYRLTTFMELFYREIVPIKALKRGATETADEKDLARVQAAVQRLSLYEHLICGLVLSRAVDMYLAYLTS